jgi:glycine/D-amino acid oxidase-like deaminating enzyme/nitrite reductase/ring-hydroxylating ferredoxin subunit
MGVGSPVFWATETLPLQPTLDRDLTVDVVVIGAGMTGLTTAYLLARTGARVALLERDRVASGDTGHTTAHLTAVTDIHAHDLVTLLGEQKAAALWSANAAALRQIRDVVDELRIPAGFEYVPAFLHVPFDFDGDVEPQQRALRQDVELAKRWGLQASYEPSVPLMNQPGMRVADQAVVHPLQYIRGLLDALQSRNVQIFEHSEPQFTNQVDLLTCNGNQVHTDWTVVATHNPLQGRQNTAAAMLIQTQMSAYTSYAVRATVADRTLPIGLFWDTSDPYRYVRIEAAAEGYNVIAGGEDHKTGQVADTRRPQADLDAWCQRLLPSARITHRWSGQVLETSDGMPIIGEVAERQWMATGFGGNGITFGTLSAMLAANAVSGRSHPWNDLFSPRRIAALRSPLEFIRENVDYPYYLLKRFLGPGDDRTLRGVAPGEGAVITLDGRAAAVSRDDAGLYRLRSAVCTHMGCLVVWNQVERTWDCPCHGSRFGSDGTIVRGPAERDLDPIHADQTD